MGLVYWFSPSANNGVMSVTLASWRGGEAEMLSLWMIYMWMIVTNRTSDARFRRMSKVGNILCRRNSHCPDAPPQLETGKAF